MKHLHLRFIFCYSLPFLFRLSFACLLSLMMLFSFSFSALALQEELIFKLKRKIKDNTKKQTKQKKEVPLEFQRHSFSYSDDFEILNKAPKANLKTGTVLMVSFPYSFPASFEEEIEVIAIVVSPFQAGLLGKAKANKSTNKVVIKFDEIVINEELKSIETFPVFLTGKMKDTFLKDITTGFFESVPRAISLFLNSTPNFLSQFIDKNLKSKKAKLSDRKHQKQKLEYLAVKKEHLLKVIVK